MTKTTERPAYAAPAVLRRLDEVATDAEFLIIRVSDLAVSRSPNRNELKSAQAEIERIVNQLQRIPEMFDGWAKIAHDESVRTEFAIQWGEVRVRLERAKDRVDSLMTNVQSPLANIISKIAELIATIAIWIPKYF